MIVDESGAVDENRKTSRCYGRPLTNPPVYVNRAAAAPGAEMDEGSRSIDPVRNSPAALTCFIGRHAKLTPVVWLQTMSILASRSRNVSAPRPTGTTHVRSVFSIYRQACSSMLKCVVLLAITITTALFLSFFFLHYLAALSSLPFFCDIPLSILIPSHSFLPPSLLFSASPFAPRCAPPTFYLSSPALHWWLPGRRGPLRSTAATRCAGSTISRARRGPCRTRTTGTSPKGTPTRTASWRCTRGPTRTCSSQAARRCSWCPSATATAGPRPASRASTSSPRTPAASPSPRPSSASGPAIPAGRGVSGPPSGGWATRSATAAAGPPVARLTSWRVSVFSCLLSSSGVKHSKLRREKYAG